MGSALFAIPVLGIIYVVLGILLLISPLLIWKHTRRSADALEQIRATLAYEAQRRASAEAATLEELRLLREVLKSAAQP